MNHPRTQTSKNFGLGWRGRGRAPTAPTSREGPRERRSGVEHRDLQHIAATSRKRHHTDLHQHPPSVTPKPLAAKETGPDGSSPGRSLGPGPGCSSAFPGLAAPQHPQHPQPSNRARSFIFESWLVPSDMRVEIAAPFMSRICRPRSKDRIEVASLALGAKKQDRDRVKRERERQREIERWRDGEIARYRERCGMLVKRAS